MSRSLRYSPAVIPASIIHSLKLHRVHGRTDADGIAVVLESKSGNHYTLDLVGGDRPLPKHASVYVWWGAVGPVCAPIAEVDADEASRRSVTEQVSRVRQALAHARLTRTSRHAAGVDIQLG